ncbi:c-type cytochrome domain-containing protein [Polaribacter staleyi]|uniref:c-type cytochrome domain-containing protein n=1 Tax=Polaribacter staleyi TaxID=2022337 RepID=UPI0031BA7F06
MENSVPDFVLFIGRFHPLLVHLPIGFLVFAFLLELYSRWQKDTSLTKAIPLALLVSGVSALFASILGYMLSLSGDYEESMVDSHLWFGVATTVFTFLAWLIRIEKIKVPKLPKVKTNIAALTLLVVLISITGHYGGNLTHGSDYLVKYIPFGEKEKQKELAKVTKIEDALVFDHLVNPILENKCASCHNESKKKGGLSLQDSLSIMKGGKNGTILTIGDASASEMIKRVLLNPDHDDFMPPKGKTPLTEEETAILTYWINNADANFKSTIGAIETPENILGFASSYLGLSGHGSSSKVTLPVATKIDDAILQDLINEGFRISELVFDSNIYEVGLPAKTVTKNNAKDINTKLEKLLKIKDNVLWLYLEDNQITDIHLKHLVPFKNLQKLKLNNNPITDNGISKIVSLKNIESINLYNTNITKASLASFDKMKSLKNVYVWKTDIAPEDKDSLTKESKNKLNFVFGL